MTGGTRRARATWWRALALLPPGLRVRAMWTAVRLRRLVRARRRGGLADLGRAGSVLVLAVGVDADGLRACVEAVRSAQRDDGPQPLVLTDLADLALLRGSGLAFEYVPPQADWERVAGPGYDAFLERRVEAIAAAYGARPAVVWSGDAAALRQDLRAALREW